ncbi:hypothetical protein V5O48_003099 [Marasmius crinis-equi]|uniref:HAT C-terminal dimerisation domain-containing protein n=1 Tax=Marasmius crinis-equi TaxID=585013 RepID=A0ABR3FTU0_9AGAR
MYSSGTCSRAPDYRSPHPSGTVGNDDSSNSELEVRLLKWIIDTDQSPSVVATPEFRNVLNAVSFGHIPDPETIGHGIRSMAEKLIGDQKEALQALGNVPTLSVDFWAPRAEINHRTTFVTVTIPYAQGQNGMSISPMEQRLLNFCEVNADVASMADAVLQTLKMYGLEDKTVYYLLDNDPENDLVIKELQRYQTRGRALVNLRNSRLRCGRHTIYQAAHQFTQVFNRDSRDKPNLAGRLDSRSPTSDTSDGDIAVAINKLRGIIAHIKSRPVEEWKETIKDASVPDLSTKTTRGLLFDKDPERQGVFATSKMMHTALHYRSALELYVSSREELRTQEMSAAEWDSVHLAATCLALFVSELRQTDFGSRLPTSGSPGATWALFQSLRIQRSLATWVVGAIAKAPHPSLETALRQCHKALMRHHFGLSSPPVYAWTSILDPCMKVHAYGLLTGASSREELERTRNDWGSLEERIFHEYFSESLQKVITARQELHNYARLPLEPTECDAIGWWKEHSSQFPLLAPLALKILAIPGALTATSHTYSLFRKTAHFRRENRELGAQTMLSAIALLKEASC